MGAFDLSQTFVHLGLGTRAVPIADFEWSAAFMDRYVASTASDGNEGRLVCIVEQGATWDTWERHPAGEELVVLLSGRVDLVQHGDRAQHQRKGRCLCVGAHAADPRHLQLLRTIASGLTTSGRGKQPKICRGLVGEADTHHRKFWFLC